MLGVRLHSVGLVGAYSTKYETRSRKKSWELLREAVDGVLKSVDNGIDGKDIDFIIVSNFSDRFTGLVHTAPLVASWIGARNARGFRIESACAAGGAGLYLAYNLLRTGLARNVLVAGYEKMSMQPSGAEANEVLAAAGTPDEILAGATFFSLYALIARNYLERYGATEEDLALVAVKNHENALRNPLAQYKRKITVEDVMKSPYVAPPLKLYDCSPLSDGAAAVILSSDPKRYTDTPVYIAGAGMAFDEPGVYARGDMAALKAAKEASGQALKSANLDVNKIDFFEVHDCFTIAEVIIYEMLGLAKRGEGYKLLRDQVTFFHGEKPVNPSGGLKAKGHPIGATGVGMACEAYWQLRGEAGERQVKDAETGLMENHGGSGGSSVVIVFTR